MKLGESVPALQPATGAFAERTGEGLDRRVALRVAARVPLQLELEGLPGPLEVRSCDIGTAGVCVESRSPFSLSSVRRVAIRIAEREMVLNAEGCWQRQGKTGVKLLTGIRFVEPKPELVRALWDFVGAQAATLAGFLRDGSAFGEIDLDDAMDLALCTRIVEVPAGHRIYGPGTCEDGADAAYVVYVGEVLLEARNDRGRAVLIERVGVGRVFGGLAVVVGVPHVESATAATAARLIEIDRESFAYLEHAKPRAARRVTAAVVRRQTSNLSQLIERATAF